MLPTSGRRTFFLLHFSGIPVLNLTPVKFFQPNTFLHFPTLSYSFLLFPTYDLPRWTCSLPCFQHGQHLACGVQVVHHIIDGPPCGAVDLLSVPLQREQAVQLVCPGPLHRAHALAFAR